MNILTAAILGAIAGGCTAKYFATRQSEYLIPVVASYFIIVVLVLT